MVNPEKLLRCPKCKCLIRPDRLQKHIKKVHQVGTKDVYIALTKASKNSQNPRKSTHDGQISTDSHLNKENDKFPLSPQSFDEVANLIGSWLRRKKEYFCKDEYIITLTFMFLQNHEGYSFEQIVSLHREILIDEKIYRQCSIKLMPTYEIIYGEVLQKARKRVGRQTSIKSIHSSEFSGDHANWHECNTVDPMDGSKYIGYTAREYESSRYGSYPIHDDYGDESWADGNPWE